MVSQLVNALDVSGIVEVSMDKIALWVGVCVDDWTAKSAIIASNALWVLLLKNDKMKNPAITTTSCIQICQLKLVSLHNKICQGKVTALL